MKTGVGLEDVQAGDVVCVWRNYSSGWRAEIVTRTTPHRIFIGGSQYDRATGRLRGQLAYSAASIEPLTPERCEEARLDVIERAAKEAVRVRANKLDATDWKQFSPAQLERVLDLVAALEME